MTVITARISEALIKEHASNPDVREINDPSLPVRFRYLTDRTKGSWFYCGGKIRYKKLGSWPLVKCALIRDMMPQIQINLASGLAAEKAVIGHFVTVSELLAWHLETTWKRRDLDQTRKQGIKTAINRYILPLIGDVNMVDLKRPILLESFFLPIQEQYAIATIRLAFGVLKSACARATAAELMDFNPISDIKLGDFLSERVKPRAAVLEPRHLPEILNQVLSAKPSHETMMIGLMVLHGTRIGETRLARWEQFDFIDNTWTIPADITKGTSPELKIMLTDTTVSLLKRHKEWQTKRGYDGVWLFRGSKRSAMTPTQANNCTQRFSARKWTAHHIRKAYRDLLAEVGTDFMVAERMINHSLTTIVKTYNQREHYEKARAANQAAHKWLKDRIETLKTLM